jgi:hypothetical protein
MTSLDMHLDSLRILLVEAPACDFGDVAVFIVCFSDNGTRTWVPGPYYHNQFDPDMQKGVIKHSFFLKHTTDVLEHVEKRSVRKKYLLTFNE